MRALTRIVRRLRLRAPSASASRRAGLLIEDAMRTASLPDTGGRIVLVRRLGLGRIDPRAPPQTVALALERGVARLGPAVEYADADRPRAGAVWFRDALDAHTRLALRLAAGDPVDAWYWPLAVRAWRPSSPVPEALRDIALSLAALPEAPVALPRWVWALCGAGYGERLVIALHAGDVVVLARAARLQGTDLAAGPAAAAKTRSGDRTSHPRPSRETSERRRKRTVSAERRADPRRVLLRALLSSAHAPSAGASPLDDAASLLVRTPKHDRPPAAPSRFDRVEQFEPGQRGGTRRVAPRRGFATRADPLTEEQAHVPAHGRAPSTGRDLSAPDRVATSAGGLLFLVPALVRIGYPDWQADHPEWARFELAARAFACALGRLRVAPDDPAWLFAAHGRNARSAPHRFIAPAPWADELCAGTGPHRVARDGTARALWDPSGRLLLGAWRGACPRRLLRLQRRAAETGVAHETDLVEAAARAWLVAARRWLRRRARIGLADLVLRPATLSLTPTHADVHFDLAHTDLRVRGAGLDLDPGWVPWLGRVVAFHYER